MRHGALDDDERLPAQSYPSKPICIINTTAAGGPAEFESRDMIDRLVMQGHEPHPSTPEQMRDYTRRELDKWGKLLKAL